MAPRRAEQVLKKPATVKLIYRKPASRVCKKPASSCRTRGQSTTDLPSALLCKKPASALHIVSGVSDEASTHLELVRDHAPAGILWNYPLHDDLRRCFVGHLPGALSADVAGKFFDTIRNGVDWVQTGPRKTCWMVKPPCTCSYEYGGFEVKPTWFPKWMWEVMDVCMPLCGFHERRDWPNSCNLNLYDDGWGSVGWHADDEFLFQGWYRDCLIISLSLGEARYFEVKRSWSDWSEEASVVAEDWEPRKLWLKGGDLCTMEGMTQRYYVHQAPKDYYSEAGPRVNLTWRWIVEHSLGCPDKLASPTDICQPRARRRGKKCDA